MMKPKLNTLWVSGLVLGCLLTAIPQAQAWPALRKANFSEEQAAAGDVYVSAGLRHSVIDLSALAPDYVIDVRPADQRTFSVIFNKAAPRLITVKSNLTRKERQVYQQAGISDIVATTHLGKVFIFNVVSDDNPKTLRYALRSDVPLASLRPVYPVAANSQQYQIPGSDVSSSTLKPAFQPLSNRYENREQELLSKKIQAEGDLLRLRQTRKAQEEKVLTASEELVRLQTKLSAAVDTLDSESKSQPIGQQLQALLDTQKAKVEQLRQAVQVSKTQEEAITTEISELSRQLKDIAFTGTLPMSAYTWERWAQAANNGEDPATLGYSPQSPPPSDFDPQQVQFIASAYAKFHPVP
jgi:hypothetical protein